MQNQPPNQPYQPFPSQTPSSYGQPQQPYYPQQPPQYPSPYSRPPQPPVQVVQPMQVNVTTNDGCWKVFKVVLIINLISLLVICGCVALAGGGTLLSGLTLKGLSNNAIPVMKGTAHHKLGEVVDVKMYMYGDLHTHESVKVLDIKQVPSSDSDLVETQNLVVDAQITNLLSSPDVVGDFALIDATSQEELVDPNAKEEIGNPPTDLVPHIPKTITLTFSQGYMVTPQPGAHPYILTYEPDMASLNQDASKNPYSWDLSA